MVTPTLKLEAGGRYTDDPSLDYVDVLPFGTPLRPPLPSGSGLGHRRRRADTCRR